MSSTLIATTRRGACNALRFQGILVTESYAQLTALLEARLSPRHARFLAEPAHDASGNTTDWYAHAEGPIRPIAELPEGEKARALRAVSALASDIGTLAETLKAGPDASSVVRGNILSLALRHPGEECLYMAGDQPLLTCWGFDPGSPDVQPEDLVRPGIARPAPATAPAGVNAATATARTAVGNLAAFPWWSALLRLLAGFAAALALYCLIALLSGPFDRLPSGERAGGCSPPPPAVNGTAGGSPEPDTALLRAMSAEREKAESLRRELADLRRRLEARIQECPRTPPPPEPEKNEPENRKEDVPPPTMADLMPVTPDPEPAPPRPEPKPTPKPTPKPAPKPETPRQKKGEDLKIPDAARKNNDMGFLEGCWNSASGLADSSGDPVVVTYCFDAKGNGTRAITRKQRGDRCAGPVQARFDGSGKLLIDADGAACPRGSAFVPHRVECVPGAGGHADCNGREQGGFKNRWNAQFRKN